VFGICNFYLEKMLRQRNLAEFILDTNPNDIPLYSEYLCTSLITILFFLSCSQQPITY